MLDKIELPQHDDQRSVLTDCLVRLLHLVDGGDGHLLL